LIDTQELNQDQTNQIKHPPKMAQINRKQANQYKTIGNRISARDKGIITLVFVVLILFRYLDKRLNIVWNNRQPMMEDLLY
jgi:hypothetical protein